MKNKLFKFFKSLNSVIIATSIAFSCSNLVLADSEEVINNKPSFETQIEDNTKNVNCSEDVTDAASDTSKDIGGITVAPTSIELNNYEPTLSLGSTFKMEATVLPSGSSQSVIFFGGSESIATIDSTGLITAHGYGTTSFGVQSTVDSSVVRYFYVHVNDPLRPTSIELNNYEPTLSLGSTFKMEATVLPNGSSQSVIFFGGNQNIATIDRNSGLITTHGYGTTSFGVQSTVNTSVTRYFYVNVNDPLRPTSIELNNYEPTLSLGSTFKMEATVLPNGSSQSVIFFGGNENIATIDRNTGIITTHGYGTTSFGVESTVDTSVTRYFYVHVNDSLRPTSIELNNYEPTISLGSTFKMDATVLPNGSSQSVIFFGGNENIAIIDRNTGLITARGVGTTSFGVQSAVDMSIVRYFYVHVENSIPPTHIDVNNSYPELVLDTIYSTFKIEATVLPTGASQSVVFFGGNENIATIDRNTGLITAHGVGTTSFGVQSTVDTSIVRYFTASVYNKDYAIIDLNEYSPVLCKGDTFQMKVTSIKPNIANREVSWFGGDPNIATIDSSTGVINAINYGKASFGVKNKDGNLIRYFEVTVEKDPTITLEYFPSSLAIGLTYQCTATVDPPQSLYWFGGDENIATIDERTGVITTKGLGQTAFGVQTLTGKSPQFFSLLVINQGYAVDISRHNGNVDFNKLKGQGLEYAIIRDGYGRYDGVDQKDSKFEQNVERATNANVPFGFYHYSYLTSVDDGYNEANYCLSILNGRFKGSIIAYDLEDDSIVSTYHLTKNDITQAAVNFCETVKNAGYVPMIYANYNWFTNYIDYDRMRENGYKIWYAQYVNGSQIMNFTMPPPPFSSTYLSKEGKTCDIFQYSSHGVLDGNGSQYIDLDVTYTKLW